MFKSILIFIILIIKLASREYEYLMKKNNVDNNEFNPYIFNFIFRDNNYSFIFDTSTYLMWIGNQTINKNYATLNISTIHGEKILANEICKDGNFCYFTIDKEMIVIIKIIITIKKFINI